MNDLSGITGAESVLETIILLRLLKEKKKEFFLCVLNKKRQKKFFCSTVSDERCSLAKSLAMLFASLQMIISDPDGIPFLINIGRSEKVKFSYGALPLFDNSGQVAGAFGFFVEKTSPEEMREILKKFQEGARQS
jgi:hypothetical protein